ncbi:MAG: C-GCAxxG-C-C family protein, partial [Lachnospiraceae bacterium]|nr:C-GCAxxG-C-C family protein [Lachnospiraceae bacterium]
GALIGAIMVAGCLTKGQATPKYSRQIVDRFQELSGATICKELKGIESKQKLCDCPDCVYNAITALGEVLSM